MPIDATILAQRSYSMQEREMQGQHVEYYFALPMMYSKFNKMSIAGKDINMIMNMIQADNILMFLTTHPSISQ